MIAGIALLVLSGPADRCGADENATDDLKKPSPLDALAPELEDADDATLPALLDQAAAIDLAGALELAARHEAGHGIIAGRWRPEDSAIGPTFATALNAPPSQYRDHLVLGLLHQWVRTDPQAAEQAVRSLPETAQRAHLVEQFQLALLRFRPAIALESAIAHEGSPGAIDLRDAAVALARSDLEAARKAFSELPGDRVDARETIASAIARIWSSTAPEAAARWAAALPLDGERQLALEESVYAWSDDDPKAAGKWVAGLEAGPGRDAALQALVFQAAPGHPELAFQWAQLVSDPSLRETCLGTALFAWSETDVEAAREAVRHSPLSDKEKTALRELLETPGA